jgi:hypothetical protein
LSVRSRADRDIITGAENEVLTITGAAGTLNSNDVIVGTDSGADTLNVTLDEDDIAPTITGIETINVSLDVVSGADATLDATEIDGATITLSSSRTAFDGEAEVDNVGDNNIVAGTNVDTLTLTGVTTGVTDTGSAETVSVTTDDDGDTATVILNGDVDLTIATAETLDISATVASEVTLTPGAVLSVSGDANTTLVMAVAAATGLEVEGVAELQLSDAGTVDVSDVDVATNINFTVAGANDATVADGAQIELSDAASDLTLSGDDADFEVTLTIGDDQGDIEETNLATLSIVTTDDVTIDLITTADGDVEITVDGDLEITDFASDDELSLSGTGDVTLTDIDEVSVVDAEGLTGELTIDETAINDVVIVAGSAALSLTLGAAAYTAVAEVVGSIDDDAVDASTVTAGEVYFDGLAGDDTLTLEDIATGTIEFDGGAGEDTLSLADGVDLSAATVTLTDVEIIELAGDATVMAALLDGEAYEITGAGFANSTLTVQLDDGDDTADLSDLVVSDSAGSGTAITVVTGDGDDVITLTSIADTVEVDTVALGGIDTLIGFDGDDFISFDLAIGAAVSDLFDLTNVDYDAAADLEAAIDLAIADNALLNGVAAGDDYALVFTYDDDTYALVRLDVGGGDVYDDTADALVIITGTDVDDLAAANFLV